MASDRPFPSSLGLLYQNEVKCSAFDMEMIIHAHANKTHFHKKGFALGLILKVRVFGTRKRPIFFSLLVPVFGTIFFGFLLPAWISYCYLRVDNK